MESSSGEGEFTLSNQLLTKIKQTTEEEQRINTINSQAHRQIQDYILNQVIADKPVDMSFEKTESKERKRFLQKRLSGRILDVGSGPTAELDHLELNGDVTYLDFSTIDVPQSDAVLADARKLPFRNKSFQSIYCSLAIGDGNSDDKRKLQEMFRVIKPQGTIVLRPGGDLLKLVATLQDLGIKTADQCSVDSFKFTNKHTATGIILNGLDSMISIHMK